MDGEAVEEALQDDDGSTHNVKTREHSIRECDDWTVYFRPVKNNNGKGNAIASNVPEVKTVL